MFGSGWKFNIFNERSQDNKQIAAVAVIFAQVYFSILGMFTCPDHEAFSIIVFAYSLISLFSFINV